MYSVAEKDNEGIACRINPNRSACESCVPERAQRKQIAFISSEASRDVLTEAVRCATLRNSVRLGHRSDGQRAENARSVVNPAV